MDTLENKIAPQPDVNDLQNQFDALRRLVVATLILVLVISGTLNMYLYRQCQVMSRELGGLGGLRQQVSQLMAEHQRGAPMMKDFVSKMTEYGRTHPDFTPILAKYGLKPGTNVPSAAPRSAPPAAPKK